MRKGLTLKQQTFIKEYLKSNGNATQAVLEVYDVKNRHVAESIGYENLRKPAIQREIRQALEAKGLTHESIAQYLKTNIVAGLGVKAKASDSLRGIDIYARLIGAYNQPIIEQSYKVKLKKLTTKELKLELEKRQRLNAQLLEDLKNY